MCNLRTIPALALLLASAACSGHVPPPPPAPVSMSAASQGGPNAAPSHIPATERLLIRRAVLEMVAHEPGSLAPRVTEITRTAGGYVESSTATEGRVLRMTLRVPSAALEPTLASLSALAEVEERRVSAQDVTEQVFDLEARLGNLRAVRDRLRQHLDRAGGVGDVIQVERELARVQGEIEVLEGRLKRLQQDTSLSQITLEVRQKRVLGPLGQLVAGAAWLVSKLFVIR